MLNNNFNSLTPWDSQNPYNPRLNQKQALWANLKKKENNNFQYYNILSAYEVKDETSTSSTYVSLVFYHIVRSRKILVKK
jgi:transposase